MLIILSSLSSLDLEQDLIVYFLLLIKESDHENKYERD